MGSANGQPQSRFFDRIARRLFVVEDVGWILLVGFVSIVGVDALVDIGVVRSVFAFVVFALLPGVLVLTLAGFEPKFEVKWLPYTVGVSLLVIMAVGLLLNVTLPLAGINRPVAPAPLGVAYVGLLAGLLIGIRLRDPERKTYAIPSKSALSAWKRRWIRPTTLALLLVPVLTVLSVSWLNLTSDNRPLIAVLVCISVIPLLVVLGGIGRRWVPLALWTSAISVLYHDTLWIYSNFRGHGTIVSAAQTGQFSLTPDGQGATTSLLPNVTVSPTFANLGGHDVFLQLDVFNPLLVTIIPIGSFVIFRRFVRVDLAAVGAFLVIFIHPFYLQLPHGGRATMPVLFIVLLTLALTDYDLQPVLRQALALGFAAALVTSHYGGAYFVMVGLAIALIILLGLRVVDSFAFASEPGGVASDGGTRHFAFRGQKQSSLATLSVTFVLCYVAMAYGWYLHTNGGHRVIRFFERVEKALVGYLTAGAGGGGTANRITREYGMASVTLSRYLYILLAVLTLIAACGLLARRYRGGEWRQADGFDEYFALGTGVLGVFSITFVFQAIWGGGRPMAIAFSVSALFAVFGMHAIFKLLARGVQAIPGTQPISRSTVVSVTSVVFAGLIGALFVLNSGVAAATVLGGQAPSDVPLQPIIEDRAEETPFEHRTVHQAQDVSMLVWLETYANDESGSANVFGDKMTRQSSKDVYDTQITGGVEPGESRSLSWSIDLTEIIEYQGEAYVALPSYSVNQNVTQDPNGPNFDGARRYFDLSVVNERLSEELKLYTNGESEVYRLSPNAEGE